MGITTAMAAILFIAAVFALWRFFSLDDLPHKIETTYDRLDWENGPSTPEEEKEFEELVLRDELIDKENE